MAVVHAQSTPMVHVGRHRTSALGLRRQDVSTACAWSMLQCVITSTGPGRALRTVKNTRSLPPLWLVRLVRIFNLSECARVSVLTRMQNTRQKSDCRYSQLGRRITPSRLLGKASAQASICFFDCSLSITPSSRRNFAANNAMCLRKI